MTYKTSTHIVAKTDIGNNRDRNEDVFAICPNLDNQDWGQNESFCESAELGSLLIVADGMGGTNAGETASNCAIQTIRDQFVPSKVCKAIKSEKQVFDFIVKAVKDAHRAINDLMAQQPETVGMGTTIVICWLLKSKAHVAWCGDSRCYVYNRKDGLKCLTKDHSLVQEMIDRGDITKEEAFHHPDNHIITKGLGAFDTEPIPDIVAQTITPNDIVLLCSDGLSGYCDNQTIEKIIEKNRKNLHSCCDGLVNKALESGNEDNITVVLASLSEQQRKFPLLSTLLQILKR